MDIAVKKIETPSSSDDSLSLNSSELSADAKLAKQVKYDKKP